MDSNPKSRTSNNGPVTTQGTRPALSPQTATHADKTSPVRPAMENQRPLDSSSLLEAISKTNSGRSPVAARSPPVQRAPWGQRGRRNAVSSFQRLWDQEKAKEKSEEAEKETRPVLSMRPGLLRSSLKRLPVEPGKSQDAAHPGPSVRSEPTKPHSSFNGSRPSGRDRTNNASTAPSDASKMKLFVENLPPGFETVNIYQALSRYGDIEYIDIYLPRKPDRTNAWVTFCPAPQIIDWTRNGIDLWHQDRARMHHVTFRPCHLDLQMETSPLDPKRKFAREMKVAALKIKFGIKKDEDSMLLLHQERSMAGSPMEVVVNLQRKVMDVNFAVMMSEATAAEKSKIRQFPSAFKMRLSFAQMGSTIVQMTDLATGNVAWIITMEQPPQVFRKTYDVESTHETGAKEWTAWKAWFRQTDLDLNTSMHQQTATELQKRTALVDLGRWLAYVLVFENDVAASSSFCGLQEALRHQNFSFEGKAIDFAEGKRDLLWNWLNGPSVGGNAGDFSNFFELQAMSQETIQLPFNILYQLEACISHGAFHECNINKDFLLKLMSMENERAVKLLEKVADEKGRFYNPDDIFRRLLHKVSVARKPAPAYCAMIRSATVTPTTVYFMAPVLETSNRVIRKFQHLQDRFLRVKFTDEKYIGRVRSKGDDTMNEVFTHIKRTMTNGIKVGGRHYEYLAFGNSQFREHGAWFFASTNDLTAQQIRESLGDFSNNKVVAKYCSRIGQCFSTTRATTISVNAEYIPDIERNGYCFTDGVGMISPFLAQMIVNELRLPNTNGTFPSAFQFRREGCKGILVVNPLLKGSTIQIRPSQAKFVATQARGLEICRISQFSAAYLNVQLILILSALGVEDKVFVTMMRQMLKDIEEAMESETKALELLQKNVDHNQMTLQIASMILDGFKETGDPFTISCLRLWRSWSLKYLKEKARILVENGAFVLGCVDETATLRGHFNWDSPVFGPIPDPYDLESLPEIFLQLDSTGDGNWKVQEGVCILARNPSLHPGDVRIVRAVDVKALHHIRNCVVLPQTGDRDIPNMCSGGDLDGDDYLVIWDKDLLPQEWNHPPMDYTPPTPVLSTGKVTADDMTSFFVTHMKHDNLARIAVTHKYWADAREDGVKDPICLELAQLHSCAVDFAKTGVPAIFPDRLRIQQAPHWSERKGRMYHSKKIVGQLYDEVQRVPFQPGWELEFDQRVLEAYELDDTIKEAARDAKRSYDEAIRRIMARYAIKNEFEVWTTFVLEHSDDMNSYKFAETLGEMVSSLKEAQQKLCYEKAGTNSNAKDWSKMGPFIAAMYAVTAEQVTDAMKGMTPNKRPNFENMPFISFPWLFSEELGRIANKHEDRRMDEARSFQMPKKPQTKKPVKNLMDEEITLDPLEEVSFAIEMAQSSKAREPSRLTVLSPSPVIDSSQPGLETSSKLVDTDASMFVHSTGPESNSNSSIVEPLIPASNEQLDEVAIRPEAAGSSTTRGDQKSAQSSATSNLSTASEKSPEAGSPNAAPSVEISSPDFPQASLFNGRTNSIAPLVDSSDGLMEEVHNKVTASTANTDRECLQPSSATSELEILAPRSSQLNGALSGVSPAVVPAGLKEPQASIARPEPETMILFSDSLSGQKTSAETATVDRSAKQNESSEESDGEAEEVTITFKPSALNALEQFAGS